jgi:hypothetical protein
MTAFFDKVLGRLVTASDLNKLSLFFRVMLPEMRTQPALTVLYMNHDTASWMGCLSVFFTVGKRSPYATGVPRQKSLRPKDKPRIS